MLEENRSRPVFTSTLTSVGRFYEKRQQWNGALDQYSQVLASNPDETALYIDRSRIFLKLGSIGKAHQDTGDASRAENVRRSENEFSFVQIRP